MKTCDSTLSRVVSRRMYIDRRHVQILNCQYRVSWHMYVSRSATYWKAAKSVCLRNTLALYVDYLLLVCSQCQCPALHIWRQHLRNSLCFSEQSQKCLVLSDDGKFATSQVLVKLLQSVDDGQSLFIDRCVVFLSRRETSRMVHAWFLCTISHDTGQDGSDAIWRGITCQYQRLGRVEMCYHLWRAQHLFGSVKSILLYFPPVPPCVLSEQLMNGWQDRR